MEKVLVSKIVFECPIFKVEEADVELSSGKKTKRWYVVKPDAVGVVAIDAQGKVLLTKEYRSASGEVVWRIPAGGVKNKETPEETAQRELQEETGHKAGKLELLVSRKHPSGYIKQTLHFFLATNLKKSPLLKDEDESIEVVSVEIKEAVKLAKSGKVKDEIGEAILKAVGKVG